MGALANFFTKLFTAPARARVQTASHGMRTTGSKYPSGLSKTGYTRIMDNHALRSNARDADYDSELCHGISNRFADSIVDIGLKLKSEPNARVLGISLDQASEWATDVAERFHLYAASKQSDKTGVNNLYQNQRLYAMWQFRDNDMFTRLHYSSNPNLISPLQIQYIDPDQIGGRGYVNTFGYQQNNDGIERDSSGIELKYKVSIRTKDGYKTVDIPASVSGRKTMLHGYRPDYAGQGRGVTQFAHALQRFEDITSFQSSHILKAIHESQFVFYTKPSKDAPASSPLADVLRPAGPVVQGFDEEPTESRPFEWTQTYEATFTQPGGIFMGNLQSGEDIGSFPNNTPSAEYHQFLEAFCSHLCASVGMPIEVFKIQFGENYSASRATLVLFWRILNIWRAEMASDLLNPILEAWLSEEIAAGRIKAPGWSDPRLRAAWLNCRWIGSSLPSLDPKKEAQADQVRVELSHETLDSSALKHNGSNASLNRAQLNKELPGLPIPPWSNNYQGENKTDG